MIYRVCSTSHNFYNASTIEYGSYTTLAAAEARAAQVEDERKHPVKILKVEINKDITEKVRVE